MGKTVVAVLLTRYLLARGVRARTVKPIGSGGRDDAVALRACQPGVTSLDEINPWPFAEPLAPLLAARRKRMRVEKAQVVRFLMAAKRECQLLVVEGAGGVLSPLGEGFADRELIVAMNATPIVVCPNRLGVLNQAMLVLEALPAAFARRAHLVLVNRAQQDASASANARLLRELSAARAVHEFPWLGSVAHPGSVALGGALGRALKRLVDGL